MSKKKNTLKDLDEFLKQQAATLVSPTSVRQTIEERSTAEKTSAGPHEISVTTILNDLKTLSAKEGPAFRGKLCDLIIQSIDAQGNSSAEDKMLINTALYLKNGNEWKEAIRQYWKGR
jgi:hypothetical protein